MNCKIKIITNFRREEGHSVSVDEAHKAYYLFLHPNARSIFSDGLALRGEQIQEIIPDYHGTMGWNPTHRLDSDDWNEIRKNGVVRRIATLMAAGREVARLGWSEDMDKLLPALIAEKYPQLDRPVMERREGTVKAISGLIKNVTHHPPHTRVDTS